MLLFYFDKKKVHLRDLYISFVRFGMCHSNSLTFKHAIQWMHTHITMLYMCCQTIAVLVISESIKICPDSVGSAFAHSMELLSFRSEKQKSPDTVNSAFAPSREFPRFWSSESAIYSVRLLKKKKLLSSSYVANRWYISLTSVVGFNRYVQ